MNTLLSILILVLPMPALAAQQDSLTIRLRANARTMELTPGGELSGPGGEFLRAGVRAARFTMVAEEHGIVEVPKLAEALWREAQRSGYSHFAIETGEQLAVRLETALRADRDDTAYLAFLNSHWPGAPFFNWRQDAGLLRAMTDAIAAWCALGARLRHHRGPLRAGPAARAGAKSRGVPRRRFGIAADSALARDAGEESRIDHDVRRRFGGVFATSRRVPPRVRVRADRILTLMDSTLAINLLFPRAAGMSQPEPLRLMKRQFWRFYDSTRAAEKSPASCSSSGPACKGRNYQHYDLGKPRSWQRRPGARP
jgi:hypothetical protein